MEDSQGAATSVCVHMSTAISTSLCHNRCYCFYYVGSGDCIRKYSISPQLEVSTMSNCARRFVVTDLIWTPSGPRFRKADSLGEFLRLFGWLLINNSKCSLDNARNGMRGASAFFGDEFTLAVPSKNLFLEDKNVESNTEKSRAIRLRPDPSRRRSDAMVKPVCILQTT